MAESRRIPTIILLALLCLSAACTRVAPTLSYEDRVATMVAGTLAVLPPSSTGSPTDSGEPPAGSATPSSEPTATVTSTPTVTPTVTPGPADPRVGLNLSNPDYTDDFSVPGRWYNGYEDAGVRLVYEGQAFAATDKLTDYIIFYSGSVRTDQNSYAEIDMTIGSCTGRDAGGMAVRVGGADYDKSYVFEVSCNGQYRLRKFLNFSTVPLVLRNWTYSDAINQGSSATNRLGVYADGDELYLFVNGVLLTENPIEDNEYSQGRYGIFASAAETLNLKVLFDNFAVWVLAP
jgi:hypothetical protein